MFIKKTVGYVMAKSAVSLAVKSITTKDSHATSEQSYIKETIDGFFDDLYPKCLFRAQADYLDSYYKTIFAIQKSENRLSTPRKPQNNVEEMINSSLISKRESIYTDIQNHIANNPSLSEPEIVSELNKMLSKSQYLLTDQAAKYRSNAVLDAMKNEGYEEYIFHSSNSGGTCAQCCTMDGKIFNLNEAESGVNIPPLHPNCQCSISPNLGFHIDLNFLVDYDDWVIKYLADNRDVSFYSNHLLKGVYTESQADTDEQSVYLLECKVRAKEQLNKLIDQQFRLFAPKEITIKIPRIGKTKVDTNVILSSLFDKRLTEVLNTLNQKKQLIRSISLEFGVPAEVIGSVILREQYCEKIPDSIIVTLEQFGRKGGSVGLGAIQSGTARKAWEAYVGKEQAKMLLPQSDSDLAKLLEKNDEFNIRTIAAVLVMYAIETGKIENKEQANRLPIKGWKSSVGRYNSPNAEEARNHSDGVFAYIDDVKILLN